MGRKNMRSFVRDVKGTPGEALIGVIDAIKAQCAAVEAFECIDDKQRRLRDEILSEQREAALKVAVLALARAGMESRWVDADTGIMDDLVYNVLGEPRPEGE